MFDDILIGLATGLLSGVLVGVYFYFKGKLDAEVLYRKRQLDEVLIRLKQLSPDRDSDERGYDGVGSTCHWLTCMGEAMDESGFPEGNSALRGIASEIKLTLNDATPPKCLTSEQIEKRKMCWYKTIRELSESLPRLLKARSKGTPMFHF